MATSVPMSCDCFGDRYPYLQGRCTLDLVSTSMSSGKGLVSKYTERVSRSGSETKGECFGTHLKKTGVSSADDNTYSDLTSPRTSCK